MTFDYASFLVRCWRAPDGERRFLIEHIQSGERAAVPSLGAALERIAAWAEGAPPPRADTGKGDAPDPPVRGHRGG